MGATTSVDATNTLPAGTAVATGGGAAGVNGAPVLPRSRHCVVVIDSDTPRNAPAGATHGFIVLDGIPPAELLAKGGPRVRHDGGLVASGAVTSTAPAAGALAGAHIDAHLATADTAFTAVDSATSTA